MAVEPHTGGRFRGPAHEGRRLLPLLAGRRGNAGVCFRQLRTWRRLDLDRPITSSVIASSDSGTSMPSGGARLAIEDWRYRSPIGLAVWRFKCSHFCPLLRWARIIPARFPRGAIGRRSLRRCFECHGGRSGTCRRKGRTCGIAWRRFPTGSAPHAGPRIGNTTLEAAAASLKARKLIGRLVDYE
jgi:hypothetical protein